MPEFSTAQRKELSAKKMSLPDGSYPIRNVSELKNAIASFGRAKNPELTKKWIIKRAKELDATDLLPEAWGVDSVEQSETDSDSDIMHFGVLGMKWGVRKKKNSISRKEQKKRANKKTSRDYNEAEFLRKRKVKSLSNAQLKKAITRMQLEQQYKQLSEKDKSKLYQFGKKLVDDLMTSTTQTVVNTISKTAKTKLPR